MRKIKKPIVPEMIFVIISLMILTYITVNQFGIAKMKARDVARKSDINSVSKALDLYFADYKEYPDTSVNELWGKPFNDATGYIYLKLMPRENSMSRNKYCYLVSVDKKSYLLLADLEYIKDADYKQKEILGCGNKYHYATGNVGVTVDNFVQLNK